MEGEGDGGDGSGDGNGLGNWFWQLFDANGRLELFFLGRVHADIEDWTFLADIFGGKLRETVTFRG